MKRNKILAAILLMMAMTVGFSLTACGGDDAGETPTKKPNTEQNDNQKEDNTDDNAQPTTPTTPTTPTAKQVGGDISLLAKYEQNGAQFKDQNGVAIDDVLTFLKNQGLNSMRVRLFVNPANASEEHRGEGVIQDLDYVKALGKRIKAAGMTFLLDFHYSDTWADPVKQWTPKEWQGLSDAELYARIYTYTKDALQQLKAAGAEPDFIQTGNEISYGMMWGAESSTALQKATDAAGWKRFIALLEQAAKACREVCPNAKTIIHTELVRNQGLMSDFYNNVKDVDYDIIGLSYYPYYHGLLPALETALNTLQNEQPTKEVMIVETGYYHKWQPDNVSYDYSSIYAITDKGQQAFTKELVSRLNKHTNVVGLYWWWLEANEYGLDWGTQRVTKDWYNASLFDNETGRALPALGELQNFK